jgi:ribosomal protection tetracycline resistance protein
MFRGDVGEIYGGEGEGEVFVYFGSPREAPNGAPYRYVRGCIRDAVGEGLEGAGGKNLVVTGGNAPRLRGEPAPIGTGVQFRRAGEVLGTMPLAFFNAVEDAVHETLQEGLYGWQVIDCVVTMTHSGYAPRQSHAHQGFNKRMSSTGEDFRNLTALVLMDALKRAQTRVCEPIHRFHLEIPADTFGTTAPVLAGLSAAV